MLLFARVLGGYTWKGRLKIKDNERAENVIERLQITNHHAVLDIGSGGGPFSRQICDLSPRQFVHLDFDHISLKDLSKQHGQEKYNQHGGMFYLNADALDLPFATASFDRVIYSLVLYLIPLRPALHELHRVLRPAGRAYIRVPMLNWGRFWAALQLSSSMQMMFYSLAQLTSGLIFYVSNRQFPNYFLRHDHWACYMPQLRFEQAVRQTGFQIDYLTIDYPRPQQPSLNLWISKPTSSLSQ
jgi:ubiquinone/menaquinone biosynthesis C-methylase UbiE